MPDYAALRLRLSVRTACLTQHRKRARAHRLPPAQAALIGGLVLAAAWTGGAAMAQVGELAQGVGLLQPAVLTSAPAALRGADPILEAARKREAEQKHSALLVLVSQLATAVKADPAAAKAAGVDALLDQLDQVADARARQLTRVVGTLGIDSAALPSVAMETPGLIKVSAPETLARDYGLDSSGAERLQRLAARVRAVQGLSAALNRLPVAAPLANPVRSSAFGVRSDPFTGSHAFHAGQDFSGRYMTAVEASAPGIVSFTGQRNGYGNTVEVDHGNGFKTRYAHLASTRVHVGQAVEVGQKLGGMGSTGRSTGTHLHYEVWVDGVVQNPDRFLRAGLMLAGGDDLRWAAAAPSGHRWTVASRSWRHHGRMHARFRA